MVVDGFLNLQHGISMRSHNIHKNLCATSYPVKHVTSKSHESDLCGRLFLTTYQIISKLHISR